MLPYHYRLQQGANCLRFGGTVYGGSNLSDAVEDHLLVENAEVSHRQLALTRLWTSGWLPGRKVASCDPEQSAPVTIANRLCCCKGQWALIWTGAWAYAVKR
jgi:hypothetical protein